MGDPNTVPLARHKLFETQDLDEARDHVARVFCPHKLLLSGRRAAPAVHNSVDLGGLSLNYMTYGSDVRIDPGELERFYLLQIPLAGTASVRCGTQTTVASMKTATLLSPSLSVQMDWSWDCEKILVQIDKLRVERILEALIGRRVAQPVEFDTAFQLDGPRQRISRLVHLVIEDIDSGDAVMSRGLAGGQLTEALIAALLGSQRHTYSAALEKPAPTIAPRHVKRAEEFMRAHVAATVTLSDLAGAAGVSVRALQDGFRRFRETTPLESLRTMRMEAARDDLLAARAGDSVTSIALRWGFSHLSRFAVSYRHRYHESPSETLRRGGPSFG